MNATAPRFFVDLNYLMWCDVLLHLARLTDAPSSRGKANLTVGALAAAVPDQRVSDEVARIADQATAKTDFAWDWRNRHLAHRDLQRAQDRRIEPLAPGSRAHVEEALAAIRAVLDCVQEQFEGSTTHFQDVLTGGGGTEALMNFQRKGHDAEMDERARRLKESRS